MKTLQEAWQWYECTARQFHLLERLSHRYWTDLPWDILERDERFRYLDRAQLMADALRPGPSG